MSYKYGKDHHNWTGGKTINNRGYVMLNISFDAEYKGHRYSNNQVLEHRYVMEKHLRRLLKRSEIVHHKNGIKTDNRIENLEVMDSGEHIKHHKKGIRCDVLKSRKCPSCEKKFFPRFNSSNTKYCSNLCTRIGLKGKRKPVPKKICKICGDTFQPEFYYMRNSKYCGRACSNEASQRKRKPKCRKPKTCGFCKKEFFSSSLAQRFCSISCSSKNRGVH